MHRVWNLSTLHRFKKEEYKKSSTTKKILENFKNTVSKNPFFQGFYNAKKNPKTIQGNQGIQVSTTCHPDKTLFYFCRWYEDLKPKNHIFMINRFTIHQLWMVLLTVERLLWAQLQFLLVHMKADFFEALQQHKLKLSSNRNTI